jgi:thiol-disulfide isomerase/thioredoxin
LQYILIYCARCGVFASCRCGPCKVMAPKFQEMSEKNLDVVFLKLDCNQDNKVSKLDSTYARTYLLAS